MKLFFTFDNFKQNYFNLLLALLPISFIAGNLIININVILIIFSAILFYRKKVFSLKYLLIDKLILAYFFLIIFTGVFNDFQLQIYHEKLADSQGHFYTTMKSFLFLKYLLFYFVLRYLIEKNNLNLKYFFLICALASLFVCFDIYLQFISGKDIFGFSNEHSGRKLGGPFGDELIAGGFIQRFSLFALFLIPIFFKNNLIKFQIYLIPFLLTIFIIGIILSGNRMPFILYLMLISLVILFQKGVRKFFFPFIFLTSIAFFIAFNFNFLNVKGNFYDFYKQVDQIKTSLLTDDTSHKNAYFYYGEFATFYDTWRLNKTIGGGIKNFRYYCHARDNIDKNAEFKCNMHPHNYYLEILTETGILGFLVLVITFCLILYKTFYKKYFSKSPIQNNTIIPFLFLFFVEVFPIKSTGSFFTTGNATYLFLILGILIGLSQKDISIEKKI